jgi:hypothetical protein
MIETFIELGIKAYEKRDDIKSIFRSKYLNYNIDNILSDYSLEEFIGPKIPYSMIHHFVENPNVAITFRKVKGQFKLQNDNDVDIKAFQIEALHEFKKNGKFIFDDHTVSLRKVEQVDNKLTLSIQQSKYSDQVQSHLTLDWDSKALKNRGTLRGIIKTKYKTSKLPPLNCSLLSNSIGISVIIYYKNQSGEYIPYLPLRNKAITNKKKNSQALYEGVYHCSASGVLKWKDDIDSIDWIKKEMYREIEEEVGISTSDLPVLSPIAFVRELLRSGKPQLFFIGFTDLSENEIVEKRKKAISIAKKNNDKIEFRNKHLLKEFDNTHNKHLSLEAIGNLYLANKYKNCRNQFE